MRRPGRVVVDASAQLEILLQTPNGEAIEAIIGERSMHAPELQSLETLSGLRKMVARGAISAKRASIAAVDLEGFPIERYDHAPLLARAWSLRGHVTPYDASYLALAERLGASLVTVDPKFLGQVRGIAVELPR